MDETGVGEGQENMEGLWCERRKNDGPCNPGQEFRRNGRQWEMSSVERTQNGSKGGEVRQVADNLIRGLKSKISNTG